MPNTLNKRTTMTILTTGIMIAGAVNVVHVGSGSDRNPCPPIATACPQHNAVLARADTVRQFKQRKVEKVDCERICKRGSPILDPIPGEFGPTVDHNPPSEAEIWSKVTRSESPSTSEIERHHARFLVEKISEKADPCTEDPAVGRSRRVHCHYKVTVYFDDVVSSDNPILSKRIENRVAVVYLDKDRIVRCAASAHDHPPNEPLHVTSMASGSIPPPPPSIPDDKMPHASGLPGLDPATSPFH